MGPNDGPTPTPTPTHGPLVDDFEGGDTSPLSHKNYWKGTYDPPSVDTLGTSSLNIFIQPPGAPGNGLQLSGVYGSTVTAPPYPFVAERIYLTPNGKSGSENVLAYGANGFRFSAMQAATPNNPLVVKLILKTLSDFTESNPNTKNAYHYHSAALTLTGTYAMRSISYSAFTWGGSWALTT